MLDSAYISIGANRSSSCAAAFDDGVLAYGAGSTVALWDMVSSTDLHLELR
jgi:hypothetical protein